MPLALLALAIGAFGIGTTEFVTSGLLPEVADEFGVSIPTAGLLTTGYALGVVVGAPILAIVGSRVPRKRMLMALMGLFVAGNALSALAPAFGVMLAGRIVASLAHGAFFGIGAIVAAGLVAPQKKAGAIAMMFTGLTVANVVGVPMGTLVGQNLGWRVTFFIIAGLGVLAILGIAALVPEQPRPERTRISGELATLRNPQVILAMAMTVLGFGGVFTMSTYITPMMTEVTGYAPGSVTWLLVLFGAGMVVGNLVGGRYADRALMPLLYVSLSALALVLALLPLAAHNKVTAAVAIPLIGAFGFASVPPLQKRVLDQTADAPTLASAVNIGAFNLGNAIAAWLGGVVISAGFGYTAPNWVGALMAAAALLLAVLSASLERRAPRGGRAVTGSAEAGVTPGVTPGATTEGAAEGVTTAATPVGAAGAATAPTAVPAGR
ncbi:MFS transporter [Streptomyces albireticuli]|uniref:MFS transporter n=1 Tax=Streptomyces albireticuli TaxID=1940 RepID=A0A2A2CYV7_9ACTN|nr:MFS transporter [Streptomyces albireticuli]MCD9143741.1 MFS transporter [Streptomyces albireticuli]MCD9161828.1 MFS transporter [Streptomyces albireticuli]MCD9191858.1 MFS transporter [Streptomyces albireticuli]PAU44424.1 MFS transporter [Streptomyces albireticuli]